MATVPYIYWEKQHLHHCAVHACNNLVQNALFTEVIDKWFCCRTQRLMQTTQRNSLFHVTTEQFQSDCKGARYERTRAFADDCCKIGKRIKVIIPLQHSMQYHPFWAWCAVNIYFCPTHTHARARIFEYVLALKIKAWQLKNECIKCHEDEMHSCKLVYQCTQTLSNHHCSQRTGDFSVQVIMKALAKVVYLGHYRRHKLICPLAPGLDFCIR